MLDDKEGGENLFLLVIALNGLCTGTGRTGCGRNGGQRKQADSFDSTGHGPHIPTGFTGHGMPQVLPLKFWSPHQTPNWWSAPSLQGCLKT